MRVCTCVCKHVSVHSHMRRARKEEKERAWSGKELGNSCACKPAHRLISHQSHHDAFLALQMRTGLSWTEEDLVYKEPLNTAWELPGEPPIPGGNPSTSYSASKLPADPSSTQKHTRTYKRKHTQLYTVLVLSDASARIWLYACGSLHLVDTPLEKDGGPKGKASHRPAILQVFSLLVLIRSHYILCSVISALHCSAETW